MSTFTPIIASSISQSAPQATASTKPSATAPEDHPLKASNQLRALHYERKNQFLPRLPDTHSIVKRPIIHAPIASPFAGSQVQKIVYVSSKTPVMSAVKRVRKFLHQIEKRATQDVKLIERGEKEGLRRLKEAQEKLSKGEDGRGKGKEEILVKASGRAMAKAIAVGDWFRTKESDWQVYVEVRAGSVSVVDDVIEVEKESEQEEEDAEEAEGHDGDGVENEATEAEESRIEGGDTTMELSDKDKSSMGEPQKGEERQDSNKTGMEVDILATGTVQDGSEEAKLKKRRRRRKKRKTYVADDVPEQRLRWIKTVEVAISFKA